MGLRDFVEKRRAEQARPKTLAELRAAKRAEKVNTDDKPKAKTLAELRAAKRAQKTIVPNPHDNGRVPKKSKLDFHRGGIRYHNVQQYEGYWTVDVSNGDITYTFHNRCGSWMHDIQGRDGWMAEPARVAKSLGVDMGQLEMSQNIMHRLELELRDRGIPTREQQLRQHEEEAKSQRRKRRKTDDEGQD